MGHCGARPSIFYSTKFFKHTNLKIAFKINSFLEHNLQTRKQSTQEGDKYIASSVSEQMLVFIVTVTTV
jgi:hypothetical protein